MSPVKSWTRHYQDVWQERSGNPSLPMWLRVASLAYGCQERNGHCPLAPGDIEVVLSTVDQYGQVIYTPDRSTVNRAIRTAIAYGFIGPGSNRQCLIVPAYMAEGGSRGNPSAQCKRHGAGHSVPRSSA